MTAYPESRTVAAMDGYGLVASNTALPFSSEMQPASSIGRVYTRPWTVELMLDLAGYCAESNLVDAVAIEPACGDGAFLLAMIPRLIESCLRQHRHLLDCQNSLIAFEIDGDVASRTRAAIVSLLLEYGLSQEEARMLGDAWVQTADALLALPSSPTADFVIGNPPYVRLEEVAADALARYRKRYTTMVGRADLYIPFFEAALAQLKPQGVCVFICADRWMRNQYGAELRRLVTAAYSVETVIEMHNANPFEDDVNAYPAVVAIRRQAQGSVVVASADARTASVAGTVLARSITTFRTGQAPYRAIQGLSATRVESWFEGAAPWPCGSPERLVLLKRLEAEFYPLEAVGTGTKVTIGVATGADDIFLTHDRESVEKARLLPLAMVQDIQTGEVKWSGHYLINPWEREGLVDLSRYPRLGEYLGGHRRRLEERHIGKKRPQQWYRTIDRVNLKLLSSRKLYVADIKDRLIPVLDSGETYPHHNLYVITSSGWDLEVLGGLLLADTAQFFIECYAVRMRGGYLRFQAQYLRRIRVPRPYDLTHAQIEGLRSAFRRRDRAGATEIALNVYGIATVPQEPQHDGQFRDAVSGSDPSGLDVT